MEFSGRLASVPLADLLQWASNDRRTGVLAIRTTQRQKRISFADGEVVGCHSDDPAEYFGQYLYLHRLLDQERIIQALTWCREHQRRLGEAVAELGLLPTETVQQALRHHVEDTVCDLFLWPHGVFYFENTPPVAETLLPDPVHTMGLVMEGTRWIDELGRIRKVFVHDNVVLHPGPAHPGMPDGPLQERILEIVQGPTALWEIYARLKGSHYRFLEATFDLTLREALDVHSVGEEMGGRGSTEIRIFDLLLEQAVEDQVYFSRRHLSLPLELLDRFFPLWVGEPAGQGSDPDEPFLREMDGERSLHDLLHGEEGAREARMELVLLELQEGRLALLPRPIGEFREALAGKAGWLRRLFA